MPRPRNLAQEPFNPFNTDTIPDFRPVESPLGSMKEQRIAETDAFDDTVTPGGVVVPDYTVSTPSNLITFTFVDPGTPQFLSSAPSSEPAIVSHATVTPDTGLPLTDEIIPTDTPLQTEGLPIPGSSIFSSVRHLIEAKNTEELMFVFFAGQSLSRGTTLQANFETLWPGDVDADRAYMLDFNHPGISARGWDHLDLDPSRFAGLMPMQSHITETPAPSVIAQLLTAYDDAGRIAPKMLNVGAGAIGASLLELMTSIDDLVSNPLEGLARTGHGGLFVVPTDDGRYAYYVNNRGKADYLNTHRHEPGLWDTMEAQIGFAARAAKEAGYDVHDQVAMSFIHGQADAKLTHATFDYTWAMSRYLEMVEAELARATERSDLTLTVAITQVRGDRDANVAFDQLDLIRDDDRVHFAGTQMEFQGVYGSNPGTDNIHLSPEGYVHMGQSIGAFLGQALLGQAEDPILIDAVALTGARRLTVTFSGLDGVLVNDTGIFSHNPDLVAPDYFGFNLARRDSEQTPTLTNAVITAPDTVDLAFDTDLSGEFRLHLGRHGQDLSDAIPNRAFESYNGTTLRDSAVKGDMIVPTGYQGDEIDIFEFIPTQYIDLWIEPI